MMRHGMRPALLLTILVAASLLVNTCSFPPAGNHGALIVPDLLAEPQRFAGSVVTVEGAYVWRGGDPPLSVLAPGYSHRDNGLDAQPLGDTLIWVDSLPENVTASLHAPGDAIYGFVRLTGTFESGQFGPSGSYAYRIAVTAAESIAPIEREEVRVPRAPVPAGQVGFYDLLADPGRYHGQTITVRGYYFWNSLIYVLAEGISTEADERRSSPLPVGQQIWMEGFPPEQSARLNLGPNNTYVWGYVEVTGTFQTGGGFGRDGRYQHLLLVQTASVPDTP